MAEAGLPAGFVWGAVRAGIKASGNLDLAAAVAPAGATAAAMFTRNQVVAAPLKVGRRHLEATGGRVLCGIGQCRQRQLRHGRGWRTRLRPNLQGGGRSVRLHL